MTLLHRYPVHWQTCLGSDAWLWWSRLLPSLGITLAYVAIPLTLAWIWRRRGYDIPVPVVGLAGAFVASCGLGHMWGWYVWAYSGQLDALTVWDTGTALVSWAMVGALVWYRDELVHAATGSQVREVAEAHGTEPEQALQAAPVAAQMSQGHRRLVRRVMDAPVGICEVSPDGVVEEIDGGALDAVGADRDAWLGQQLTSPRYLEAVAASMRGETTVFAEMDPVSGERPTLVLYSPRGGPLGEPTGAVIAWVAGLPGQTFEVRDA